MVSLNWNLIIEDMTDSAFEAYFQNDTNRIILSELVKGGDNGVSFNKLSETLGINPSVLQRHLKLLLSTGLIENFLQRTVYSRDYSRYKLSVPGRALIEEIRNTIDMAKLRARSKLMLITGIKREQQIPKLHLFQHFRPFSKTDIYSVRNWYTDFVKVPGSSIGNLIEARTGTAPGQEEYVTGIWGR